MIAKKAEKKTYSKINSLSKSLPVKVDKNEIKQLVNTLIEIAQSSEE